MLPRRAEVCLCLKCICTSVYLHISYMYVCEYMCFWPCALGRDRMSGWQEECCVARAVSHKLAGGWRVGPLSKHRPSLVSPRRIGLQSPLYEHFAPPPSMSPPSHSMDSIYTHAHTHSLTQYPLHTDSVCTHTQWLCCVDCMGTLFHLHLGRVPMTKESWDDKLKIIDTDHTGYLSQAFCRYRSLQ
jgi:hypothetical protein